MNEATVLSRLRGARMRLSTARIGVMQVLQAADPSLLGADDVHRRMTQRGIRASLGTVYRALHELEARGLLLREWGPHRKAVYRVKPSGFDEHPLRLVCPTCGHSTAFTDERLLVALQRAADDHGVSLAVHTVAIPCECRRCSSVKAAAIGGGAGFWARHRALERGNPARRQWPRPEQGCFAPGRSSLS